MFQLALDCSINEKKAKSQGIIYRRSKGGFRKYLAVQRIGDSHDTL